jgi:hypothetical protein
VGVAGVDEETRAACRPRSREAPATVATAGWQAPPRASVAQRQRRPAASPASASTCASTGTGSRQRGDPRQAPATGATASAFASTRATQIREGPGRSVRDGADRAAPPPARTPPLAIAGCRQGGAPDLGDRWPGSQGRGEWRPDPSPARERR